eukprot:9220764-Lingulodinium_polyedra.AAC.1
MAINPGDGPVDAGCDARGTALVNDSWPKRALRARALCTMQAGTPKSDPTNRKSSAERPTRPPT